MGMDAVDRLNVSEADCTHPDHRETKPAASVFTRYSMPETRWTGHSILPTSLHPKSHYP